MFNRHWICVVCMILLIAACAKKGDEEETNPFQGVPAKTLYEEAKAQLGKKEYSKAISRFEALETMYPFNDYAEEAELNLIYAYYKKGEFPSAAGIAPKLSEGCPHSAASQVSL